MGGIHGGCVFLMFTNRVLMSMMSLRAVFLVLLFLCQSLPLMAAAEPVGEAKLVVGEVVAQSVNGGDRKLAKNSAVYEGDLLVTGPKGFAVVVLVDKTRFTLRPETSFKIEEVKNQDANQRVLSTLLKGGLKIVTGQIAKTQPESFKINTTLGSIGVRGTKFDVWLCLDDQDCLLEYRLLGDSLKDILDGGRLLFVRVSEGVTTLLDCDGVPEVGAKRMGVSDGTIDGCSIIDVPPEMSEKFVRDADEELDEQMSTLEAPLLQQLDFGDVLSVCDGDPLCLQCDGDPACMQCNGDVSCYDCQSDPLCAQCAGDATCIACNGDPLCVQCQGDSLCISCSADASCIQCNGNATCISCGNDPICLCNGDTDCLCGIDSSLPQCLMEDLDPPSNNGGGMLEDYCESILGGCGE